MEIKRIKKINSHVGLARFLSDVNLEVKREIPREMFPPIPSPYCYSPTYTTWEMNDGREIFWVETSHKCYEVFQIF
jgi:hypothetical protein